MRIKRTFAPDIRQAMRRVREEQGADAVILGNRKVEGGVEVLSAIDYDEESLYRNAEHNAGERDFSAPSYARVAAALAPRAETADTAHEHVLTRPRTPPRQAPGRARSAATAPTVPTAASAAAAPAPRERRAARPPMPRPIAARAAQRQAVAPAQVSPRAAAPAALATTSAQAAPAVGASKRPAPAAAAPAVKAELDGLRSELHALRGLMENQLHVLGWDQLSRRHPNRVAVLSRLTEMDIGTDLARTLVDGLREERDVERAWRQVLADLARQVPIADDDFMSTGGVVALVGATGVGKTTTVAKLAARFSMQHGQRNVALVTTDTYRVGAQEQLLHFAQIIGVPLYAANDREELGRVLARLCDKKLVLIDTAGMSQRDVRLIEQFANLREGSPLLRSYLVMSANTQLAALDEVVRAFGAADLAGCIITKLDESTSLGSAITVSVRHRLPVAYVGTGQRVPEDLSPARAHRLVSRAVPLAQRYGESADDDALALRFAGVAAHAHG